MGERRMATWPAISDATLRQILEIAGEGLWELDRELQYRSCAAFQPEASVGGEQARIEHLRAHLSGLAAASPQWLLVHDKMVRRERFRALALTCCAEYGTAGSVSLDGVPRFDEAGRFAGYQGLWHAFDAAATRDEWSGVGGDSIYRELSELSSDWYWEQDAQFRFTWFSPDVERKARRSIASLLGRTRWELAQANLDEPRWRDHLQTLQCHEPFREFETQFTADDGSVVWVNVSGVPKFDAGGRFRGYRGTVTDITRGKRAEKALRESEERFRDFARASNDWMSETDAEGRYTWIGGAGVASDGTPLGECIGKRREEFVAPGTDLASEPWKSYFETLARRQPFRDLRFAARMIASRETILSVSGVPYFTEGGRFLGYRNVGSDITAQVRAEQAANVAHSTNERLAAAIDYLNETIALCDAQDRLVMVNRGFRDVNHVVPEYLEPGTPYAELLRALLRKGCIPEAAGREQAWLEQRLARRRNPGEAFEVQRQGGRWVLLTERRLPDGGLLTYGLDITALKRDETARLAAVRRQRDMLIREVHHRIKNNLQGVIGLLMQNAGERPELAPLLRRAVAQVQLVAVVHGLQGQAFAGGIRVCELVPEVARNVESLTRCEITLEAADSAGDLWLAESESVAVALIVNELLFNAVKNALSGRVSVQVRQVGALATVAVRNGGTLAADFDFDTGAGIGTGLELVRALIPGSGVRLSIREAGAEVLATLELAPPVVFG